ncbi:N-lysine methyltransferase KMT5A-like [Ranitomeya variabilis]|uniref:N-lysine methyltransferase KMT5A-like n=1 Tax=Ranitomeya variabilis TaxID=490064 RepID=UPI004055C8F8
MPEVQKPSRFSWKGGDLCIGIEMVNLGEQYSFTPINVILLSPVVKRKRIITEEKDSNEESGNEESGNEESGNEESGNEESGNEESGNKKSGRWEKYSYYQKLLEICPVHLNNTVPKLSICKGITKNNAKYCQEKWRRSQYQLRVADVAGHFRHRPKKDEVAAYIESQGWKSNFPRLDHVSQAWKKPESRKEADDSKYIMDMVKSQEWRGLVIIADHKRGGRKLMTTRGFKKGDIVCDYHGVLMDAKAAEELQQTIDENCYMYFFLFKEKWMCIDATEEPCQCHQNLPSTFGRIVNHSTKMNNLKPEVRCLDGKDLVILFVALKDLKPGTELLLDYGIRRSQRGEGAELPWLDS